MRKIALLVGLVATTAVAEPLYDVKDDRSACLVVGSFEACERWEQVEPDASRLYWRNVYTTHGWSVAALADYWGVDVEKIAMLDLSLLSNEAVDSVDGFNPYKVDFKNADEFERSDKLNHDQKWKWLRYRRMELGVCFEDEFLNGQGQCELD